MSGEKFQMSSEKFDIRWRFTVKCPKIIQNVQRKTEHSLDKMSDEAQINLAYPVTVKIIWGGLF